MPHRSGTAPDPDGARLASYQALLGVSRMLLGSASLEELLDRITHELKRLVPYDVLTIYQVDHIRRLLVPLHSIDLYAAEILDAPLAMGQGLTGWVVEHRLPQNVPDAHLDPRIQLVPGTDSEPEAIALVPLLVRGAPIGALNVYRLGEGAAFGEDEFELICHFADLAALALDNTRIREQLTREAQTDWLTGLYNHRVFHERVRDELERAHRYRRQLSVVTFDLDDFKLLNDVHGHQEGDLVLRRVAAAAGGALRSADRAFRVGGEEFAILMPETSKRAAKAAADRLCTQVRGLPGSRPITVSCGVATFPDDAKNPTELLAAADAALYVAKERGKDRAVSYSAAVRAQRLGHSAAAGRKQELESLTQIKLLGALAGKLNRLNDVWQIADTIVAELRTMIDYHNARVYLLGDDRHRLEPVAFGGNLSEYAGETFDALRCEMGEGITGTAAQRGQTLNIGDAQHCEFAEDIEGSADIDESILAVPMRHERRTIGVIVLSKLGLDQFSQLSVRLLELLAAQAAVAFENARLLEAERRSAAVSQALLGIATMAATDPSVPAVALHLARVARDLTGSTAAALVAPDREGGRHRVLATAGDEAVRSIALAATHAGYPEADELQVIEVDALPALSVEASALLARAAVVRVNDAVLVVVCDSFSDRVQGVLGAVAGQGGLALRSAELLAGHRAAGLAS